MKKLFVIVALIGTLIPAVFVLREAGGLGEWRGVMPRGTTDSLYYYARLHEVADGHPLVGNPYAYEYREALPPAMFLPDILTALPVIFGVPFEAAMLLNIFLWSLVFLLLAFALLRSLGVSERWAGLWAVVAFATSYSFMLRPTVMQIVYPSFFLFLIALAAFLRQADRKRALWLAGASAFSFYIYTYLAYVVLAALGFVFIWYFAARRFSELRALLFSGFFAGVFLIPFGVYTYLQLQNPYYLETLLRLGLDYSRLPSIEAYYYGRWIVAVIAVYALFWVMRRKKGAEEPVRALVWFASGLGLLGALMLNVSTGVDLSLGVHIGRLSLPWVPLALGAGMYEWARTRSLNFPKWAHALFAILLLTLLLGTAASVRRGVDFFGFAKRGQTVAEFQAYAAPLAWLEKNVPEESVIWSNDAIAQHIPIMTRHYPLFHESVLLHTLPNAEVEERYLLSRSFAPLTVEDLRRESSKYLGAGGKQRPREDDYFTELIERSAAVRNNRDALLAQHYVAYLLYDRTQDPRQNLPIDRAVYDDGRFAIIPLPL